MSWLERHRRLVRAEARGGDLPLAAVLWPLSQLYRLGVVLRNQAYDWGLLPRKRLESFVITIGGIAAGGTGKTPFCALVANQLVTSGLSPLIVASGYGATAPKLQMRLLTSGGENETPREDWTTAGEEALLLGRLAPRVPILVGRRRDEAPAEARRCGLDPKLLIFDGGFQDRRLCHDFSFVLLDSSLPPGKGRLLPLGDRREPVTALRRADCLILHRAELCADRAGWEQFLRKLAPELPLIWCRNRLSACQPLTGRNQSSAAGEPPRSDPFAALKDQTVGIWTALGNPGAFLTGLKLAGLTPVWQHFARDHAPVTEETVQLLRQAAADHDLQTILVTEKDAIKLAPFAARLPSISVIAAELELEAPAKKIWPALRERIAGHSNS